MSREMKDSGIEWIGSVPKSWGILPAGRLFSEVKQKNTSGNITHALQFKTGKIIPKPNFNAAEEDYVAETIQNYTIVEPGTIMINGLNLNYDLKSQRVGLVNELGVITSAYLALTPDCDKIMPEFAAYLFKGYEATMAFHNMGVGIRKTLGYKEMKYQPVLLPPVLEQNRIIEYLNYQCSGIEVALERTRASIEEYKKLKQAVITQAVTKGIRGERPMKDSQNNRWGYIPENWSFRRVKTCVTEIKSGLSAVTEDESAEDSGFYVLRTSAVSTGVFIPTEVKSVLSTAIDRLICPVKKGTLIVSRMNTAAMVGMCAYVGDEYPNIFLPDKLWRIQVNESENAKFLWYSINATPAHAWFGELATGASASMQNITISDFSNNYIALPDKGEQDEIVNYLDRTCSEIDTLIAKKEQYLVELENYKKSLIYEYVTGKKEVPDSGY